MTALSSNTLDPIRGKLDSLMSLTKVQKKNRLFVDFWKQFEMFVFSNIVTRFVDVWCWWRVIKIVFFFMLSIYNS